MTNRAPVINPIAVQLVSIVVLAILAGAAILDLYFALTDRPPLGLRIRAWGRRYPGFLAAVALLFGTMVGHFFLSLPE